VVGAHEMRCAGGKTSQPSSMVPVFLEPRRQGRERSTKSIMKGTGPHYEYFDCECIRVLISPPITSKTKMPESEVVELWKSTFVTERPRQVGSLAFFDV